MKHQQLRTHIEEKKNKLVKDMNAVLRTHGIKGNLRAMSFAAADSSECSDGKTPVVVIKVDPNTGAEIHTIVCQ